MKVLFLGDIVGRSGREALNRHLHKINLDNKNFKTIGLGFSFQKYDELPNENHDQKLDWILTENYLYKVK